MALKLSYNDTDFVNEFIGRSSVDTNRVSDGFHTFGELYDHRIALWIRLCEITALLAGRNAEDCTRRGCPTNGTCCQDANPWRTLRHSDGELAFGGGWFVLGLGERPGEQMTYHLPMTYWDRCDFARTVEQAPPFDGHTSADVLARLLD